MKLLVVTQTLDRTDSVLGFFHRWVEELAAHFEEVQVIALGVGEYALPKNVRVYSLGKERGSGRAMRVLRFYRYVWRLRRDYDTVFVHMNPEYIVLAGGFWRLWRKKIVLWYTHRQITLFLRYAVLLSTVVVTAAPESMRVSTHKKVVLGHGIDTERFTTLRDGSLHTPVTLVSVGRITPIKRLEILLDAVALLKREGIETHLSLIGAPTVPADATYQKSLLARIRTLTIEGAVHFSGASAYDRMPEMYRTADFSINLAPTGGIDKAVLESMASGALTLAANRAFIPYFGTDAAALIFEPNAVVLAEKIRSLLVLSRDARAALSARLLATAQDKADVHAVVNRLAALLT